MQRVVYLLWFIDQFNLITNTINNFFISKIAYHCKNRIFLLFKSKGHLIQYNHEHIIKKIIMIQLL